MFRFLLKKDIRPEFVKFQTKDKCAKHVTVSHLKDPSAQLPYSRQFKAHVVLLEMLCAFPPFEHGSNNRKIPTKCTNLKLEKTCIRENYIYT